MALHRLRAPRAFLLALCCLFGGAAAAADPVAEVSTGRLAGQSEDGLSVFRGIPYAAPPTGERRWRDPEPAPAWEGTRDARSFGKTCIQAPDVDEGPGSSSEDCLTLNIWAPQDAKGAPVMVWIHGGGFFNGAGSVPYYDGTAFAREGIVLVTINYRLGLFGFFLHPDLGAENPQGRSGNYGLMDQVLALRWVQENIAAFGGDPSNVTIFGESAGASSVVALMVMEEARGLFHRAIAQSYPWEFFGRSTDDGGPLTRLGGHLAERLGQGSLAGLRALDAHELNTAHQREAVAVGGSGRAFKAVIDGRLLPRDPVLLFEEGRQAQVPFLIGANSFEVSVIRPGADFVEKTREAVGERWEAFRSVYGARAEEDLLPAADALFSDNAYRVAVRMTARSMEAVGAPAYVYSFDRLAEAMKARGARGTPHGGEIPYVFETLPERGYDGTDRALAEAANAYWAAFARTGVPAGEGLPAWPAFTAATPHVMEFSDTVRVRESFRARELDWLEPTVRERMR
ncbi:MAG: carboxylesterase family protein [Alphaproteobacteria bacterium]|nr:carboxylesterase family protein [Alphaproteobacteria bacterium]